MIPLLLRNSFFQEKTFLLGTLIICTNTPAGLHIEEMITMLSDGYSRKAWEIPHEFMLAPKTGPGTLRYYLA
jgi:hypothetical protein